MSNIDQDFVEYIVKSLVEHPEDVSIERIIDEKGVLLTLSVNDEDLGRVIGKRGATAQSIRTLLRALGTKNDARYNLKISDNGSPPPSSSSSTNDDNWSSNDNADEDQEQSSEESSGEESLTEKTKKELEGLDDLDV